MDRVKPGSLREELPEVAAWIDWLRDTFGAEMVNAQIRRGMKGEPVFSVYSTDGRDPPLLIGTRRPPDPPSTRAYTVDEWLAFVNSGAQPGK